MTYTKTERGYLIRIYKGEEVFDVLTQFCEKEGITAGSFFGLGAVSSAEFGYYNLAEKRYITKKYDTPMELVHMNGNVAQFEEKPALHIHAAFADTENRVLGGHVISMTVGVTAEAHFVSYDSAVAREYDDDIGLNLLCLADTL